jgi:hypothetical protein
VVTGIFVITTIFCAVGWLKRYISTEAIIYYIEKKGYDQPNDLEISECTEWAVRKVFGR